MKRVNILACGGGWNLCPKDSETWSVNKSCVFRKTDLIFYMDRGHYLDTDWDDPEHAKMTENRVVGTKAGMDTVEKFVMRCAIEEKTPVMTTRHFDDIPNCVVYPLEEIIDEYGCDCFGNSMDYMTAYAIYKGYDDIHFYGANMGDDKRSKYEKAPLSFWIGMAMGLGRRVSLHGTLCKLLVTENEELYAYCRKQSIQRDKGMQRRM